MSENMPASWWSDQDIVQWARANGGSKWDNCIVRLVTTDTCALDEAVVNFRHAPPSVERRKSQFYDMDAKAQGAPDE